MHYKWNWNTLFTFILIEINGPTSARKNKNKVLNTDFAMEVRENNIKA